MVNFGNARNIGEKLTFQLLDHATVSAQVSWARDGRIGLPFACAAD